MLSDSSVHKNPLLASDKPSSLGLLLPDLRVLQGILSLGCAWLLKLVVDIVTGTNKKIGLLEFALMAGTFYLIYLGIYWFSKRVHIKTM